MGSRVLRFFLVAVVLAAAGCGSVSCTHRKVRIELNRIATLVGEQPEVAIESLERIDTASLRGAKSKALYSLLYAKALDRAGIFSSDETIVKPAVDYYSRHAKHPEEAAAAFYYLGRIQENSGKIGDAAISFSEAEAFSKDIRDSVLLGLLYLSEARIYNGVYNRVKEIEYSILGEEMMAGTSDYHNHALSVGLLAVAYGNIKQWEKSDSLYALAFDLAASDTVAMSVFLSGYAKTLVLRADKNPELAVTLIDRKRNEYHQPLSMNDCGVYAYALALSGNTHDAWSILDYLSSIDSAESRTSLYWEAKVAQLSGDYKRAYSRINAVYAYQDTVIAQLLSSSISQGIIRHYSDKLVMQETEFQASKYRSSLIIVLSCFLSGLGLLLLWFRNRRMNSQINTLLRIAEDLDKMKEQEALLKQAYYDLFKDKNALIRKLCAAYYASENEESRKKLVLRNVEDLLKNISSDGRVHRSFEYQINENCEGVVDYLRKEMHLDKSDLRFACYCIAGFDAATIENLMHYTPRYVYKKKSLLRKRIKDQAPKHMDLMLRYL